MSILRNKLKRDFTLTPNELLTDQRLSMGAKVVYIYLASKPDGWKVWNKEIQNSLSIKDSGTIAKYWKELLDSGWLVRERQKDERGKFTGGYDYQLLDTPLTDKTCIRENPTLGETPEHNNTDYNIKTDLDNNTNISPDGQINLNNSNISKSDGQLFGTPQKPKKKSENQFITVIENLSGNQNVRDALQKYCSFRRKRGLTIDQWQLIVEKFKQDSQGKSIEEIVQCIERCIVDGCNSLYYKQQKQSNKTTNHTTNNSGPDCFTL